MKQISCPELDRIPHTLAETLGAAPRLAYQTATPSGDGPILLLNEAANRIASGEIRVAAVAGGEALRSAAARAAGSAGGARPNIMRQRASQHAYGYRSRYGLSAPVDIYPLYENALRAASGQSLAEAQQESGLILSIFSEVAAETSGAWIRSARSPDEIVTAGPDNRPIAFPYTKLMVANSSVNQGAAFLVTSLATALDAGIPEEQLVYVGRGAAAHEPDDILLRDRFDRTTAMEISLREAMRRNGIDTGDLDFAELYSCFPCVPKMARRILGWPADRAATVFGGLTFGGGPIGNYMSHAVVCMVRKLRQGGRTGLLFANGGYATHNHTIVIGRNRPPDGFLPHDFDVQAEADRARGAVPPLNPDYEGPAAIETYTIAYDRNATPTGGAIVARTPGGERLLARVSAERAADIAFLTDGQVEPVGKMGYVTKGADGDTTWSFMP
ncbi:acetyl-CoA acetyltransferase [Rhizorhabdus dicambivorans]|uniref:acetyl-CoA acetyltransferase n=1 Tax=Rhizorhabdus dicambivorans TaxID=1850238 RepID=UPI001EDCF899|nr:acetyl-CoA acetyltransferase [Rhizorhabdus dicambivorans]